MVRSRFSRARVKATHDQGSDCPLITWTGAVIFDFMPALHSFRIPGAAEKIRPMLFTESTSTPALSSTPFNLAQLHTSECKIMWLSITECLIVDVSFG